MQEKPSVFPSAGRTACGLPRRRIGGGSVVGDMRLTAQVPWLVGQGPSAQGAL